MKIRHLVASAAALAAIGGLAPAYAQTTEVYVAPVETAAPMERIYVPAHVPSGAVHGGFVTFEDQQLLSDAVAAYSGDRRLDGSTVTIVANHGALTVAGSAANAEQATRLERIAQKVSGGRSTAFIDSMSG